MIPITVDGVSYSVPSSASDTNWQAEQVAFEQALADAVNSALAEPTWTLVSVFTNSWANLGGSDQSARTAKLPNGIVLVQGALTAGGGGPGASAFTLDSTQRPLVRQRFIVACGVGGAFAAAVLVNTDGTVVISPSAGATSTNVRDGTFLNFSFPTN